VLERVVHRDAAAAAADLHGELGLRVDVRRLRRDRDRLARPDERVRELAEDERLGRQVVSELRRVIRIVPPDADDLHSAILTY
jgi:hypothetical protein